MTLGTSLFLIAIGAILKFAVNASVEGLEISTIGLILMIVGFAGVVLSLFLMMQNRRVVREERPVVYDPPPRGY